MGSVTSHAKQKTHLMQVTMKCQIASAMGMGRDEPMGQQQVGKQPGHRPHVHLTGRRLEAGDGSLCVSGPQENLRCQEGRR